MKHFLVFWFSVSFFSPENEQKWQPPTEVVYGLFFFFFLFPLVISVVTMSVITTRVKKVCEASLALTFLKNIYN